MRYKIDDNELSLAVKSSISIAEVLRKLGIRGNSGGNQAMVNNRIRDLKLDTSHILGQGHYKGKKIKGNTIYKLEDILIKNSKYADNGNIKKRLIESELLLNKCNICNIEPEWNGTKLVLVLDHRNGIHNDNRLENLQLLCPNCNSQQPTFCRGQKLHHKKFDYKRTIKLINDGFATIDILRQLKMSSAMANYVKIDGIREVVSKKYVQHECAQCKKQFFCKRSEKNRKYCSYRCAMVGRRKHKKRPQRHKLLRLVKEYSMLRIAKIYGVTDNAIRNWCEVYEIDKSNFKNSYKKEIKNHA